MTSRELTSGFDFWSRGHLCMAVMHDASSREIWCRYLYPMRNNFSEIKDGGWRHLEFVWVSHGTTHEASFVARIYCKNFVMIG